MNKTQESDGQCGGAPRPAGKEPASETPTYAHQRADYYTLEWFRNNGYATEIRPRPESEGFQQVARGRLRKVYSAPQRFFCYRVNRFRLFDWNMPSEQPRSPEEIAAGIDTRSFEELLPQATEPLGQLLTRAAAGNETAIRFFAYRVYDLARQLETLEKFQPAKLRAVAETFDRWPVLLSHNPGDIDIATTRITDLRVGEKAFPQTSQGQKFARDSYWTRLAAAAAEECQIAGKLVCILDDAQARHFLGTKRVKDKLWRVSVCATWYGLPDGLLEIRDWERDCAKLSQPISKDNFKAWWTAIREYVREYWYCSESAYHTALSFINSDYKEMDRCNGEWKFRDPTVKDCRLREKTANQWEWDFRGDAFVRVERALQAIAGLRRKRKPDTATPDTA
jgi:hypothetical protein